MTTARAHFINDGFSSLSKLALPNFGFSDEVPKRGDGGVEDLFEKDFDAMLEHIYALEEGRAKDMGGRSIPLTLTQASISHDSILKGIKEKQGHLAGLSEMRAKRESGVDSALEATSDAAKKAWAQHDQRVSKIDKYALDTTLSINELARKKLFDVGKLPAGMTPLDDFLDSKVGSKVADSGKGAFEKTTSYQYQIQSGDLDSTMLSRAIYRSNTGQDPAKYSLFAFGPKWFGMPDVDLKVGDYINVEVTETPATKAGEASSFTIKIHDGLLQLSKLGVPDTMHKMTYELLTKAGAKKGITSYDIHAKLEDNIKDVESFAKWMLEASSKPPFPAPLTVTGYLESLNDPKKYGGKLVLTPKMIKRMEALKKLDDQLIARKERLELHRLKGASDAQSIHDRIGEVMAANRGELPALSSKDVRELNETKESRGVASKLAKESAYTDAYKAVDLVRLEKKVVELEERAKVLGKEEGGKFNDFMAKTAVLRDSEDPSKRAWVDADGKVPAIIEDGIQHAKLYKHKENGGTLSADLQQLGQNCKTNMVAIDVAGGSASGLRDRVRVVLDAAMSQKESVDKVVNDLVKVEPPESPSFSPAHRM